MVCQKNGDIFCRLAEKSYLCKRFFNYKYYESNNKFLSYQCGR